MKGGKYDVGGEFEPQRLARHGTKGAVREARGSRGVASPLASERSNQPPPPPHSARYGLTNRILPRTQANAQLVAPSYVQGARHSGTVTIFVRASIFSVSTFRRAATRTNSCARWTVSACVTHTSGIESKKTGRPSPHHPSTIPPPPLHHLSTE